jgi:hypothetical protein
MINLQEAQKKINLARETLHALCRSPITFRISVPVQPTDSDVAIADALDAAEELIKEIRRLKQPVFEARTFAPDDIY